MFMSFAYQNLAVYAENRRETDLVFPENLDVKVYEVLWIIVSCNVVK